MRGEEDIPRDLLMWNVWADFGLRPRPAEVPAPRHRLRKLGYILRDNEIRHTVDLADSKWVCRRLPAAKLWRTGPVLSRPQWVCRRLPAAKLWRKRTPVALTTVRQICRKPYTTFADRGVEAMKRLEPAYYAFLYGPGSDSPLAQALRTFLER